MKNRHYEDLFKDFEDRKERYIARKYVISLFESKDFLVIGPDSSTSLHFIFEGESKLMRAAIRQVALLSHFPNFDESTEANKTRLTVIGRNESDQYLGNLLKAKDIVLDVDVEFVNPSNSKDLLESKDKNTFIIRESDLSAVILSKEEMTIDLETAINVNMVYNIGVDVDYLPAFDFPNVKRYGTAINVFRHRYSDEDKLEKWNSLSDTIKLSNLYCADCLKVRYRWLASAKDGVTKSLSKHINALALSEHSRWNVEKLILGYRPLSETERYEFSALHDSERDSYRKRKRDSEKAHVDLCSYHDLKRINPKDMRYDYFLILAIPEILK